MGHIKLEIKIKVKIKELIWYSEKYRSFFNTATIK
jgi:hypothetical protein